MKPGRSGSSSDRERVNVWKRLVQRPDTRREFLVVCLFFGIVICFALSGRRPQPAPTLPQENGAPLAVAQAGPWSLSLVKLEACPARGIAVAVVRVQGLAPAGSGNPISAVSAPGLALDGGMWSGPAAAPGIISYAGACGAAESYGLETGAGLAILRVRGHVSNQPISLTMTFAGRRVAFPAVLPTAASPAPPGLVNRIFGH